ncbi:PqqD family protein [Arenicella xantha]|uniref:Coenzyme PQQ synthesis protein D (PqqD) n=1 Tax=Arenicella xantha TaxID=644221 RepID=A0A395JPE7_9GAMM|nr:PqqD family protein [Arenicella xantha]RBP49934.1 coenzyme PQQ synthesis protein D (PqqD) [Arenicella xantha]
MRYKLVLRKMTKEDRILQRNNDLIHANMGEETVLMSLSNGEYYGINDVGSTIWNLLENSLSVQQLIIQLTDIYGISEEQCNREIGGFLDDMEEKGLLIIEEQAS